MNKQIAMLAVAIAISVSSSHAATVRDDGVIACPSIDAWTNVMIAMNSGRGLYASNLDAIEAGRKGKCVPVLKGTTVDTMGTIGPLSKVPFPGTGQMFYFRTQDLR